MPLKLPLSKLRIADLVLFLALILIVFALPTPTNAAVEKPDRERLRFDHQRSSNVVLIKVKRKKANNDLLERRQDFR